MFNCLNDTLYKHTAKIPDLQVLKKWLLVKSEIDFAGSANMLGLVNASDVFGRPFVADFGDPRAEIQALLKDNEQLLNAVEKGVLPPPQACELSQAVARQPDDIAISNGKIQPKDIEENPEPTLFELAEEFTKFKGAMKQWRPIKTQKTKKTRLLTVCELLGKDRPIISIKRSEVKDLCPLLLQIPEYVHQTSC
jgi:hypothetical protein